MEKTTVHLQRVPKHKRNADSMRGNNWLDREGFHHGFVLMMEYTCFYTIRSKFNTLGWWFVQLFVSTVLYEWCLTLKSIQRRFHPFCLKNRINKTFKWCLSGIFHHPGLWFCSLGSSAVGLFAISYLVLQYFLFFVLLNVHLNMRMQLFAGGHY